MELNIFFFHAISTKEKMMSIFMWCKKTWFFYRIDGILQTLRKTCTWRASSHLEADATNVREGTAIFYVIINFNNLLPQVWYQAIIFWKLICTYNVYTYILYTIFFIPMIFVSTFFGAFLMIEKLYIICKEKKVIIWFLMFEK